MDPHKLLCNTKAALINLEGEDGSPGKPKEPIPRLNGFNISLSEKRFSGSLDESDIYRAMFCR